MDLEHGNSELFDGLSKFRANVIQPIKSAENPFFKSKYVDMDGVVNAVDKGCKGTGIAWFQEVQAGESVVEVKTVVTHADGGYIILGPVSMPVGGKKDAQAVGSATTYAKRYALAAAFGISSDVDDDANVNQPASGHARPAPTRTKPAAKPTPKPTAKKALSDNFRAALMAYCKINNTPTNDAYKKMETEMLTQNGATDLATATNEQLSDAVATVKALIAATKSMAQTTGIDSDGNPV